jgi:hypothetical protein
MTTARLTVTVLTLAGLDLAGSILVKEAALRREPLLALAGGCVFMLLLLALYVALEDASLTIVNLGWIVLLQGAVMAVDALRYGVTPGPVQMVAICVAMVALIVAVLAPSAQSEPPAEPTSSAASIPAPRTAGALEAELIRQARLAEWKRSGQD